MWQHFEFGDDLLRDGGLRDGDLPSWSTVLVTDDVPIRWVAERGTPVLGDELAGKLIIGKESQLVIEMCGVAITNLLAVVSEVHKRAGVHRPG